MQAGPPGSTVTFIQNRHVHLFNWCAGRSVRKSNTTATVKNTLFDTTQNQSHPIPKPKLLFCSNLYIRPRS